MVSGETTVSEFIFCEKEITIMNKNNLPVILCYIAAVCFYIGSIFNFANSNSGMGAVYLCLGSTFLCLGSVFLSKKTKSAKDKDEQDKK